MDLPSRIRILRPTPSADEAAAIVTALERFMRDTAPARHPPVSRQAAWGRAGLREAIGHEPQADRFDWGT